MGDDWQVLQCRKENFDLNKIFDVNFIKSLEENFDDVDVNIINIGIALIDKNVAPEDDISEKISLIELNNNTIDDTLNNTINVKVSNPKSFQTIKKTIDDF